MANDHREVKLELNQESIKALSKSNNEPEWLLEERLAAWKQFEIAKKVAVEEIGEVSAASLKILQIEGISQTTLTEALRGPDSKWTKKLFLERRGKMELNGQMMAIEALFNQCWIFQTTQKEAVLDLETSGGPSVIFVIAKEGAVLRYTHRIQGNAMQIHEIHADNHARIDRLLVQETSGNVMAGIVGTVGEMARMDHVTVTSEQAKIEVRVRLEGRGAQSHDISLFSENAQNKLVIDSLLHQIGPETKGDILTKGIARDNARVNLQGMIHIGPDGRGSNSFLDQKVMLLNSGAHAQANPELEIENNDVQSSHSATVGQIDPGQLFYLMSRGIGETPARRLLVEGFLESALGRIENAAHRKKAAQMLDNLKV